ncbi:MAG: hypothetical protein ACI4OH_05225 [Mitsuokella sp.]|uniref:hypothetical protein n=1 Tax=Mitsuokella sp. TaxID=2049034 RepID=UPI003F1261AF
MKTHHLLGVACAMLSLVSLYGHAMAMPVSEADIVMASAAYGPEDILKDTDYVVEARLVTLPQKTIQEVFATKDTVVLSAKDRKRLHLNRASSTRISARSQEFFTSKAGTLRGYFQLDPLRLNEAHISCTAIQNGHIYQGMANLEKGQTVLIRNQRNLDKETDPHLALLLSFHPLDDDDEDGDIE